MVDLNRIVTGAFAFACLFWGALLLIGVIKDRKDWIDQNCFGWAGAAVASVVLLAIGSVSVYALIVTGGAVG